MRWPGHIRQPILQPGTLGVRSTNSREDERNARKPYAKLQAVCLLLGVIAAGGANAQTAGNAPANQEEFESRYTDLQFYLQLPPVSAIILEIRSGRRFATIHPTGDDSSYDYTYTRTGPDTGTLELRNEGYSFCGNHSTIALTFGSAIPGYAAGDKRHLGDPGCERPAMQRRVDTTGQVARLRTG